MKLISICLLFVISLSAKAQHVSSCSVMFQTASKVAFDLEAAYTDTLDPGAAIRNSLDEEARAYFDAGSDVFYSSGDSKMIDNLCSTSNLVSLNRVITEYKAKAVDVRDSVKHRDSVSAAQTWLNHHQN